MKNNKLIFIIIFILGVFLGYIIGEQMTKAQELNWCVDTGLKMLEQQNITLEINKGILKAGVLMYKNNIQELVQNAYISGN